MAPLILVFVDLLMIDRPTKFQVAKSNCECGLNISINSLGSKDPSKDVFEAKRHTRYFLLARYLETFFLWVIL